MISVSPLATICVCLMITPMGAMISVRGMPAEQETIAAAGIAGMAAAPTLSELAGFPPQYMLIDEASPTLAKNDGQYGLLIGQNLPQMLIGGFAAVTIAPVIVVNIFSGLLWRLWHVTAAGEAVKRAVLGRFSFFWKNTSLTNDQS